MIAKVYIGNFNPACMPRHYWWFHAFSLTASGWQLKLIHHLHKNWQQLQRPRTVAGYLKNGRRIIYTENQCIRTPFSVR